MNDPDRGERDHREPGDPAGQTQQRELPPALARGARGQTDRRHVGNVFAKTASRDRVQAAILAIRAGLA